METHLLNVLSESLEFLYVLFPVVSLVVLSYRLTAETGRRTGSSLFFFSAVFYLIGVYVSFYITLRFGIITNSELVVIQLFYLAGGFLLVLGSISLYNFFIRATNIGDLNTAFKKVALFGLIYVIFLLPYFLTGSYGKSLYVFTDVFYVLIQLQFFIAYFIFGEAVFTNKIVCDKAPRRSRFVKVISFYYLLEPNLWLWSLRAELSNAVLERIFLFTETVGVIVAGFLTFNILHILISHTPLIVKEHRHRYIGAVKSGFVRRLTIIAVFIGVTIIFAGTLITGFLFEVQERVFLEELSSDAKALSVFARESEREVESFALKVRLLMKEGMKTEKIKDTIRSLKERYGELISNVFFFESSGKIFYSYPDDIRVDISRRVQFLRGEASVSSFFRDEKGFYHFLILYPDISEAGKLQGGIGIELNFEKLREQIKSLLKERSNLVMLDDSLNIISADARNFVGANFNQMLNSLVDEPESVRFVSEELGKIEGMKSFTGRVYRNSRRTLIGFSAMPIRLNSSKIIIVDYHFLDEYMFLEFLPSQAVVWILLSGFGVIFGVVVVLYLNFRFSEMLEYEVERRTNELLKSEEKYRSIVENPFFGAYLMDITGFKYVNDKFCEIFGYTKDEILSLRDYSVLIHPDDRERLKEQLRRRLSGEIEINRWNARGLRKDGKVIFIEGFTKRVEFEGKPAAQGMIIDVTEEIKQREALQQAQKLESLGTLSSGIAHDFNNILQIILGAGQLLGMKLKNTEFMRWVDTINTTAMRGAELAKRLLTFSRRKPVGDLKPVDLHHLIEDSVKIFKETFPRNIEIEAFLEAQNFVILAEESQVQQIIFNLAVNAKDAMPDGGKLIFRTENRIGNGFEAKPDVEYVVMHVIDTGVGMSDEVKRRIFEPFFTTKPPGKGTGLGLSTVYGLVKSYGGFIKVYSELGKGTKFSIYLPVYKETKVKEEKGEVKVKKTGTLLLIDDEEEIRMAGKEILEMEGFKVFVAGDGIEGINIYKEHKDEIDIVILDLNMPKMSGKETLAHLLLVNPEVKVIIATGYITEQEKEEIQGVAGYIEKPFDIVKLLQLISTLL